MLHSTDFNRGNRIMNTMKKGSIILGVLLTAGVAFADDLSQLTGVGVPVAYMQNAAVGTSLECIEATSDSTTCAIFPAGFGGKHSDLVTVVSSDAESYCCWSGDAGITTKDTYEVTDDDGMAFASQNNGPGACFHVPSTGHVHVTGTRHAMLREGLPGSRVGLCTTATVSTVGLITAYEPCGEPDGTAEDGDCGAGTCDVTPTQDQVKQAGLHLMCKALSGTSIVRVRVERVTR